MNGDGSNMIQITNELNEVRHPKWSPDGTKIAYFLWPSSLIVINSDGSNRRVVKSSNVSEHDGPTWINENTLAYIAVSICNEKLYKIDIDGLNDTLIIDPVEVPLYPNYVATANKIVFSGHNCGGINHGLFTVDLDGGNYTHIFTTTQAWAPEWNSAGTKIVFQYFSNLAIVDSDGSNLISLATVDGFNPSWANYGTQIIYDYYHSGDPTNDKRDIFIVNPDETNIVNLTNDNSSNAMFPDWFDINMSNPRIYMEPTAIDLLSFTVREQNGGALVEWETAQEFSNFGFNIYRGISSEGTFVKLNQKLIPGLRIIGQVFHDSITRQVYQYKDTTITPGTLYYYRLEDIDIFGKRTNHDHVYVKYE
ncbi:MAG: hypothetical protein ACMUIP_06270 [bacterium]